MAHSHHSYHCVHSAGVDFRLAGLDVPLSGVASCWQASIHQACECSDDAALQHVGQLLRVTLSHTTHTRNIQMKILKKTFLSNASFSRCSWLSKSSCPIILYIIPKEKQTSYYFRVNSTPVYLSDIMIHNENIMFKALKRMESCAFILLLFSHSVQYTQHTLIY